VSSDSKNGGRKPKVVVPVAVVDAEPVPVVWHEATVHLSDVLNTLEAIHEEAVTIRENLVAIRRLLQRRR